MPLDEAFVAVVCTVAGLWTLLSVSHTWRSKRDAQIANHPFGMVIVGVQAIFMLIWVVTFVLWGISNAWVALW